MSTILSCPCQHSHVLDKFYTLGSLQKYPIEVSFHSSTFCTVGHVRVVSHFGILGAMRQLAHIEARRDEVQRLAAGGASVREIAASTGWGHSTIARDLAAMASEEAATDAPGP